MVEIPFLWGRPLTAWFSILTGVIALSLLIVAIQQMKGRIHLPIRHEVLGYTAVGIIIAHAVVGFIARFLLGI